KRSVKVASFSARLAGALIMASLSGQRSATQSSIRCMLFDPEQHSWMTSVVSGLLIGAAMLRCSFRHEDTSTPRRSLSPTQIDKPPAPRASHLGFPDLMMVVVTTGRLCSPRTCRARFCAPAACPGRLPDPHTWLSDKLHLEPNVFEILPGQCFL